MSSRKLLISLLLKHPGYSILTAVFSFSDTLFNGISTVLIVPILLNFLGVDANLKSVPFLSDMISFFEMFPEEQQNVVMFGAVFIAIVLKNAAAFASNLFGYGLVCRIIKNLRLQGIKILLDVDLDYYSKYKIGYILSHLNHEINRTAGAIKNIIKIFSEAVTILVFIAILLLLSWQITVIITGLLSLIAVANYFFIKKAKYWGKRLSHFSKIYSNSLLEVLNGIRLVKSVSNEEQEYQFLKKTVKDREEADYCSQVNSSFITPMNEILGILLIFFTVLLGRYFFAQQLQSEAVSTILLSYLLLLFRLLPRIGQLNSARNRFANAYPSVEIAHDFLRLDNKPIMSRGQSRYPGLKAKITVENLSFAYPGQNKLVLKQINLTLPKGKTLALVGASGAGKSTIADLLPRFYDPTSGRITVDGTDIKEFDLPSFRRAIGIVSQDTFLFNDTIRYNLTYGLDNVSEEEIITAVKRANAYEFIDKLPQGLDTEIGDRGVMLSGGQRQRIAIARALLRNPEILILDEATSALDTVSERLVQQALEELCRERTTLVIAHRLSTIQNADQIAVLDQGKVVEVGTHSELLQQNGYYAHLYSIQFRQAEEDKSTELEINSTSQLQSQQQQWYCNVSHHARNQLNGLLGCLFLLNENDLSEPSEQDELLQQSYELATQLLNSIENYELKYNSNNSQAKASF